MNSKIKSGLVLLFSAIILLTSLTACSSRNNESRGSSGASQGNESSLAEIIPGAGLADTGKELPDLTAVVSGLAEQNGDTVGWLRIPNTTVDDVVVWKANDNDYYVRRNFEQRYDYYGIYFADRRSDFSPDGDPSGLGRNTVIYGHSMSDSKDDVKFGPMRYYLDEDFAREHPYIFFSTAQEDLAWEVVAVFYTHFDVPYNRNDLSYSEFQSMFSDVEARSVYKYDFELNEDDKFLTLSTCVYSLPGEGELDYPNAYRFGIMARLVPSGESLKDQASFTINRNVQAP